MIKKGNEPEAKLPVETRIKVPCIAMRAEEVTHRMVSGVDIKTVLEASECGQ
jgi:hypothetical protein